MTSYFISTHNCYQSLFRNNENSCTNNLLLQMQGGLVSGETATGKTETIKDLARAVAKQVYLVKTLAIPW